MPYRAVLFDLDGTLLDTLADLADAANRMLADLDLPGHPQDAYRYFIGEGVEKLVERALPAQRRDPATLAAAIARLREHYARDWAVKTRPYPGVRELVAALARRGLIQVVLSNKPDDFTRLMVAHYFPEKPFVVVRGALAGVAKKPDPAAALAIAADLGLMPAEFLYLGDSAIDMQTATRAGMHAVGAAWGFRTCQELLENGARHVIAAPLDLLQLLPPQAGA
ncbi:MAG: HAD family hydrolase [Thermodesulfobacteriota bacterium]